MEYLAFSRAADGIWDEEERRIGNSLCTIAVHLVSEGSGGFLKFALKPNSAVNLVHSKWTISCGN